MYNEDEGKEILYFYQSIKQEYEECLCAYRNNRTLITFFIGKPCCSLSVRNT
jgi:hypothetical protein